MTRSRDPNKTLKRYYVTLLRFSVRYNIFLNNLYIKCCVNYLVDYLLGLIVFYFFK